MFSIISDLFEKVVQSWWSILLYVVAVAIIYSLTNSISEGFQSSANNLSENLKANLCYGLRQSLQANKSLLVGFKERYAVDSLRSAEQLITSFTEKWNEIDCETILTNTPMAVLDLPNREDIEEKIKEEVTTKLKAKLGSSYKPAE